MVKIPYEKIVERIQEATKISKEDIDKRIERKLSELSGLLSQEGAAHIVANDLGVDLFPSTDKPLKIEELLEGMSGITINAKVIEKYDTRSFTRADRQGQVANMLLGDETGRIRAAFWNDAVKQLKNIDKDDIIQISNVYARMNQGRIELSANDQTKVKKNPDGVTIGTIPMQQKATREFIKNLQAGTTVMLTGVIVQAFRPNFYTPKQDEEQVGYVTNVILDDGTGTIRLVFFREQALELFGLNHEQMLQLQQDDQASNDLKNSLIGKHLQVTGRVNQNAMFSRTEMIVNSLTKQINIKEEIQHIKALSRVEN